MEGSSRSCQWSSSWISYTSTWLFLEQSFSKLLLFHLIQNNSTSNVRRYWLWVLTPRKVKTEGISNNVKFIFSVRLCNFKVTNSCIFLMYVLLRPCHLNYFTNFQTLFRDTATFNRYYDTYYFLRSITFCSPQLIFEDKVRITEWLKRLVISNYLLSSCEINLFANLLKTFHGIHLNKYTQILSKYLQ